jgi:hypothetical protein
MNEKYVQALILGSIIGLAIVIDDIISPKNLINNAPISIGIIDEKSKNSDQLIKILESLGSDHELKNHKVILLDASDDKTMSSNELNKIFKIKIDGNDENEEEVKKISG